ncbi:MAG: NAD(P)/FAD-dependent oxidoreductase [Steroidobacteraceae bacterium]
MPDFTLIGAGPVGTLMALMLANRGHQVRVFERRPDPRIASPERGRSINLAMAARGLAALAHAGLAARLAPLLMPMPGRMLHQEDGSLQFLAYGSRQQEVVYAVSREQLNRVLIEAAAECPRIELRFDMRCLDADPATGTVRLRNERKDEESTETFAVLLGADGANSAVRTALAARGLLHAQEAPLDHDYKELTIPPRLDPAALHIWPRGGYMLIALPNTDASFTATLFLPRRGDPGFDQLTDAAAVSRLFARQFADAAAVTPDLAQQFAANPQSRLGTWHCQPWAVAGRVLLLGDAAHAIVPFHGQGLNCGFEDCRLLDGLLAEAVPAAGPEQSGAYAGLFARFERERRPDTEAIAAMALENYQEMRDTVRSPAFARRQALAAELERRFPGRFIPRYSMVMFHPEIPYAEAQRRGLAQQRVLEALADERQLADVEPLLQRAGL